MCAASVLLAGCLPSDPPPPTRAEIALALGFRSANAAEEHLRALERKGAIELVPEFGAAYWQMSDYYGHIILDDRSTPAEREAALRDLRRVLDAAYRYSGDAPRRAYVDVDRVLFSDDWAPLHDRIERALATEGCPEPTWIELAVGLGHAAEMLDMWDRFWACEPVNALSPRKLAQSLKSQQRMKTIYRWTSSTRLAKKPLKKLVLSLKPIPQTATIGLPPWWR